MLNTDEVFMNEAFKQAQLAFAKDEVPVGAVIVFQNNIIAKAYNQVELLKDPTAHAEMIAVTQAANFLGNKWLKDCTLYVTIEPCSMCAGAMVLARLKRLCFGAADLKTGAGGSVYNIIQDERLNHRLQVSSGLKADVCGGLVTEFFQKKRLEKK